MPRTAVRSLGVVVALALCACTSAVPNQSVDDAPATPSAAAAIGRFPELSEAPLDDAIAGKLQAALDTVVAAGTSEAIAAGVIVPGVGRWTGIAGQAPDGTPLPPETQFAIASITKTVVAAQVLALAEDGAIDLDQPIETYLPEGLEVDANGATVREMLAMESGLSQVDAGAVDLILEDLARTWTTPDVVALLDEPVGPPGEAFSYNNVNYVLLGSAIEETTGVPLAGALRAGVLADPRLDRLVYQGAEPLVGPVALPGPSEGFPSGAEALDVGGGLLPLTAIVTATGAAGAMASDAASLTTWGYLLYGGYVLEPGSLAEMVDADDGYGLGASRLVESGLDGVGHGGSIPGYQSVLYADAETGTIVVVLVTGEEWPPPATTGELLRATRSP